MDKVKSGGSAAARQQGAEAAAQATLEAIGQNDHFLRLMLFQASNFGQAYSAPRQMRRADERRAPSLQAVRKDNRQFYLPDRNAPAPVNALSPAIEVMTDLHYVNAVTVRLLATIEEANRVMIAHGVRALFVTDDGCRVLGIVTYTDIFGEKPIRISQQSGLRHDEIAVRDIMTRAELLEVMNLQFVLQAQVGDVIATLKRFGRQHAVVIDQTGALATDSVMMIRGIFSLTQIARRMGVASDSLEVPQSFAEIEAAVGA